MSAQTPLDKLLAIGATAVAGEVIWKHKTLGKLVDGNFHLTDEGKVVLDQDITDVEFVEKPAPKRTKKPVDPAADIEVPVID